MGVDNGLERLTTRTYRIRRERDGVASAGKRFSSMVPARMRVAGISKFATGAQRQARFAVRPGKPGSA